MNIRAAVLTAAEQPLRMERLTLAEPQHNELVVRITSCGICHTDIGVQAHLPLPIVLGHEAAGVVERCGSDVGTLAPGDVVALTFGSCGACRNCRRDQASHCFDAMNINFFSATSGGRTTLARADGAPVNGSFFQQSSFATHALVTERNAIRLPDNVDSDYLGPLGCGVQTGAGAVENLFKAQSGDRLVCFGLGAVGLSAVMMARVLGCEQIIGIDPHAGRRELALELGATTVFSPTETTAHEIVEITDGGADFCLDSAGTVETFHQSLRAVRCGGHVGVAAVPAWGKGFEFVPDDLAMGRTISGALEGSSRPQTYIPHLAALYQQGELPLEKLIRFYAFDDINEALADLHHARVVKPVLRMSSNQDG